MCIRDSLDRVAQLLDSGQLKVPIQATYTLGQAPEALQSLTGSHPRGKLAVSIA